MPHHNCDSSGPSRSPGCRLCQQGKWLCIFLTYTCNGKCHFCPAPPRNSSAPVSAFGTSKEEILSYLGKTDFKGISFSGGDPFTAFDLLLDWQRFFNDNLPEYYFWVYTNGLSVTEEKLSVLAEAGLDEIRFNIAATGYTDPAIWDIIRSARSCFHHITIEIPVIYRDFAKLVQALHLMNSVPVDHLNLHDYIRSENDPHFPVDEYESFTLNKHIPVTYSTKSHSLASRLKAAESQFPFSIHHCSIIQKEQQMLQRRSAMGRLFSDPLYEKQTDDGLLTTFYRLPEHFAVPEIIEELKRNPDQLQQYSAFRIRLDELDSNIDTLTGLYSLKCVPPMAINQPKVVISAEEL